MNALTVTDIVVHNSEPTVQDLRLADILGYELPYDVRKLIRRHMEELQRYGEVFATVAKTPGQSGRPGTEYHLSEPQALLIAMKSDTERAADVREQLIRVFMAWRRGETGPGFAIENPDMARQRHALALVSEARMIFGRARAARLWDQLGLPSDTPALPPPLDADAAACLAHLLAWPVQEVPLRQWLDRCFAADKAARSYIYHRGVWFRDDGFVVSHDAIAPWFDGTPWPRPFEHFEKLPGAEKRGPLGHKRPPYGCATYLPSRYVDHARD